MLLPAPSFSTIIFWQVRLVVALGGRSKAHLAATTAYFCEQCVVTLNAIN